MLNLQNSRYNFAVRRSYALMSVPVAQWVKPLLALLIGHSACWADARMALAGLGSTSGFKERFSASLV